MRTTLNVDDELLRRAKESARERGVPLGHIVNDALRRELHGPRPAADLPVLPVFEGSGLQPGIDLDSNRAIAEVLDENRELDQLR